MSIQWFPGHMSKALREIKERAKLIDLIIEIVDARAPFSSRNPILNEVNKPRLIILNKKDMADDRISMEWKNKYQQEGHDVLLLSLKEEFNVNMIIDKCNYVTRELFKKEASKGLKKRPVRVMIVGVPNVGKSTFINRMSKRKVSGVANTPGFTKGVQWIRNKDIELLDTPGVLWPKFENEDIGLKMASIGSIKNSILPKDEVVRYIVDFMSKNYPNEFKNKYKLNDFSNVFEDISKNRGYQITNDNFDIERAKDVLIKEFQDGMIAKISLERPKDIYGE